MSVDQITGGTRRARWLLPVVVILVGLVGAAALLAARGGKTVDSAEKSEALLEISMFGDEVPWDTISQTLEGASVVSGESTNSQPTLELAAANIVVTQLLQKHGREVGPPPTEEELSSTAAQSMFDGRLGEAPVLGDVPGWVDGPVTETTISAAEVQAKLADPDLVEHDERMIYQSRGMRSVIGDHPNGAVAADQTLGSWLMEQMALHEVRVVVRGSEVSHERMVP